MSQNVLDKIEGVYLKIFRILLLVILTIALLTSVVLLLKGTTEMFAKPKEPAAPQAASAPSVSVDAFLKVVDPAKTEAPAAAPAEPKPAEPRGDKQLDEMTNSYVAKLFGYLEGYQKACGVADPVDKATFDRSFPKEVLKHWFRSYGQPFAESQDAFEKALLSHPKIIKLCKDSGGRAQIFFNSLDWHRAAWAEQLEAGRRFEADEARRYEIEKIAAIETAAEKRAQSGSTLTAALSSFGVFISLALLLIFSKIEVNLRGARIVRD